MRPHCFPRLRWAAALCLAVYVPAYALAYSLGHLLLSKLCAVAGAGVPPK